MKFKHYNPILIILTFIFFSQNAFSKAEPSSRISIGFGHLGVFDSKIEEPLVVKVEYRFGKQLKWDLLPVLGAGFSENDASFIFFALERDFFVSANWILSPSFGFGTFNDGEDVSLGHDLEFRTGVKVSYQFENDIRLGLELYHLSNGGLSDRNPGTEPAFISLSIPF